MPEVPTSLRLPDEFIKRADALTKRMQDVPELVAMGTLDRSKVLRLAIAKGLAALEAEHSGKKVGR